MNQSEPSKGSKSWVRLWHPRETIELAVLFAAAFGIIWLNSRYGGTHPALLSWLVVAWASIKTIYYFGETLWHLVNATACDLPYHRFLVLMAYNMAEVTFSYALDFYCLFRISGSHINGIEPNLVGLPLFFECFYFSILNFSFFGYGDILPASVAAKIVMLLEVVTAFATVIFLISDFVSMKDSMKRKSIG